MLLMPFDGGRACRVSSFVGVASVDRLSFGLAHHRAGRPDGCGGVAICASEGQKIGGWESKRVGGGILLARGGVLVLRQ